MSIPFVALVCLGVSNGLPAAVYTTNVALGNDTGLVCYDRQGSEANVPPACQFNGSQVFCMRYKVAAESFARGHVPFKSDDDPTRQTVYGTHPRRKLQLTTEHITVKNPRVLPPILAANRTEMMGFRGDYKPWITQLATGELLMAHRCEAILSSPPQVLCGCKNGQQQQVPRPSC